MTTKKKNRLINILIILLIIIGLVLIFNKQIKNFLLQFTLQPDYMLTLKREDIIENEKKSATYDFSEITYVSFASITESKVKANDYPIIGGIAIPSIDVNLPIVKGVSNGGMSIATETLKPDMKMGEGNYALAGHNLNKKGLLLSSLYLTKTGDKIYITDLDKVYEYEIVEKTYVDPSKVEVIDDHEGKNEITLVSCNQDSSKRLIVRGELKKTTPIKDANDNELSYFDLQNNPYLAETKEVK